MIGPRFMRIETSRCIECDLCDRLAPEIRNDPQYVPLTNATLDAMAECPTGAIVWREDGPGDVGRLGRKETT